MAVISTVASAVVGRTSSESYQQAAIDDVARTQPARALLTNLEAAQAAVERYVSTLEPTSLRDYRASTAALLAAVARTRAANKSVPDISSGIDRFLLLARSWQARVASAVGIALANTGRLAEALRVVEAAYAPVEREGVRLMDLLDSQRIAKAREADRWGFASLMTAVAGVAFAIAAAGIGMWGARVWRSPSPGDGAAPA
jgi:hypothetical protein